MKNTQRALLCGCGRLDIRARGLCATCYTLQYQDRKHFDGKRENVLKHDRHCCRGCGRPGRNKRKIGVHHRVPGRSEEKWMVAICPGCHARIERTLFVRREMPPFLLLLWREQHPGGHEQLFIDFRPASQPAPVPVPLFPELMLQSAA